MIPSQRKALHAALDLHQAGLKQAQIDLAKTQIHAPFDCRLEKKPVTVDFAQSEFVVIASGLSGSENVVVSDPAFAITGMKVQPIMDDDLLQRLEQLAQAKGTTQ